MEKLHLKVNMVFNLLSYMYMKQFKNVQTLS